ncbi:MAG: SPFH domain-containing protein, partial [Catalinimonas sp.]
MHKIALFLAAATALSSCVTVTQGTVGVKRTVGKIQPQPLSPGLQWFNPLTQTVIRVPVQTQNLEVNLDLPSKEGLNVAAEISILYHVEKQAATD